MSRVFIDTVANRFPVSNAALRNLVRLSIYEVTDGGSTYREERLVKPDGWTIDGKVMPFLRASEDDLIEDGMNARALLDLITPCLHRATEFVAFNASYHKRTLDALCQSNRMDLSDITTARWRCVMGEAASIMRITGGKGGSQRYPTLAAAHEYFTGTPWQDRWIWDEHATQCVFAVRRIHDAIQQLKAQAA